MSSPMDTNEIHSAENHNRQPPDEQSGNSSKRKKSILYDKSFLVDIVDKVISSKVQKLIRVYGGKILQSLEKSTDYLISDKIYHERAKHNISETNNGRRDNEIKNVPCSNRKNSSDLVSKANILNIQILSAKQFQHWLKSLLKKNRSNKKPTDKVASVLKGKVSLKIESMDQGQCPVFEFIKKWPDLGDTLCKNKPKITAQHNFSGCKSGDEYNSSDQYSTSEIGGMCELCDIPFMNYKEHINTKTHIKESQDENKFHELDELINERPLNSIFNQFLPNNEHESLVLETPSVEYSIAHTDFNLADYSNSVCDEQKNEPCSVGDEIPSILKEQSSPSSKRKRCSDTNISFVPQKRPSNSSKLKEIKLYKKPKRKHKTRKKISSKDIYKVEVVNNEISNSNNGRVESHKPSVIIRLKRIIRHSNKKKKSSDVDNHVTLSSDDDKSIPVPRHIRVVRKPSFSNEMQSKRFSNDFTFTFEQPELHQNIIKNVSYYPTNNCIPNTGSNIECIKKKIANLGIPNLKSISSFKKSIKSMTNISPQIIGEWFYNVPKKLQDDLSFDPFKLTSFTKLSKKTKYKL